MVGTDDGFETVLFCGGGPFTVSCLWFLVVVASLDDEEDDVLSKGE